MAARSEPSNDLPTPSAAVGNSHSLSVSPSVFGRVGFSFGANMIPMLCFAPKASLTRQHVKEGDWFIRYPEADNKVLGRSIDFNVLAVRQKALDVSNKETILESYDPDSPLFAQIVAGMDRFDRGCMAGWELLVAIHHEDGEVEVARFFLGTKGSKRAFIESVGVPEHLGDLCPYVIRASSEHVQNRNFEWRAPNFEITAWSWDAGDNYADAITEFRSLTGKERTPLFNDEGFLLCTDAITFAEAIKRDAMNTFEALLNAGRTRVEVRAFAQELWHRINVGLELSLHP